MIVSKTPLRMSFVGGGSDLPSFYREELGAVLSVSIDKYIYICINKKFDGRIRLSYTRTEEVDNRKQVKHPLVREAMDLVGIDSGVEISSLADIPSRGSGLGSSSSFTVGLLNAMYAYRRQTISKETLAQKACEIEINRCGEPIGKQDQYAAAYGGLNFIKFNQDDSVSVEPIICKASMLKKMEDCILVFFTGRTRSASNILAHQSAAMKAIGSRLLMRRMVSIAFEMKTELESGSLDNFGELLNENWRLKTQLAAGITDPQIDYYYNAGLSNGALGGKLLGAGNGGFIMFYAPKEFHSRISSALPDLEKVKIGFDSTGSKIILY